MSTLGRLVAKQTKDVFGDYFLKSRKSVEDSPRGQTKPKPAASYIKQMQKEGVATEEMKDLGLLDDYDPKTGPLRNKRMTKQELLDDIDRRREENLVGRGTVRLARPDEITKSAEDSTAVGRNILPNMTYEGMTAYEGHTPRIGEPDTYQEIVYSQRGGEQSRLREALAKDPETIHDGEHESWMAGMHFPETDQLFHLRVNRGVTEEYDRVTNILEIQSDVQQRRQRPPEHEALQKIAATDPVLPMVENWEKLGVKEAIRLAIRRGDRYVAVAPGREIAESVQAREMVSEATNVIPTVQRGENPLTGKEEDLVSFEPQGVNIEEVYIKYSQDAEDIGDSIGANVDINLIEDMTGISNFDPDDLGDLARDYLVTKFSGYDNNITAPNLPSLLRRLQRYEKNISTMLKEEGLEPMTFLNFMEEYILPNNLRQELSVLDDEIIERGSNVGFDITREYPIKDVAEELGVSIAEIRRKAEANEPLTMQAGQGFGGKGIIQFYDEALLSPKRVQNYGDFPVVTIKQRRDGAFGEEFVETQALDLRQYYVNQILGDDEKNKPLSLYSAGSAGLLASYLANKFVFGTSSESKQNEEPLEMKSGGDVDPVSGNDIPPGALAKEVRDDVPAMLSEGEFVFPADVVRYIGLDKLMKMRQQAKEGLAKMEDMGQMGNSDEAIISDTVPHEPIEMAIGGNVPQYRGQKTPNYMKPGAVHTAPKFSGVQQGAPQSVYAQNQFKTVAPIVPTGQPPVNTGGFSPQTQQQGTTQSVVQPTITPPAPMSYEMRRYRNEEGNVIYVPVINGVPQFAIPEGYTFQTRMAGINEAAEEALGKPSTTESKVDPVLKTTAVTESGGGEGRDENDDGGRPDANADPVMGVARGFLEVNPNYTNATALQDNINKYRSAQIKGLVGAGLSLATGNFVGAAVSLGMMQKKTGEYQNNAFNQLPPEVQNLLSYTTGSSTGKPSYVKGVTSANAQKVFTESVKAGASPALATAFAIQSDAFAGSGVGDYTDLGQLERDIAAGKFGGGTDARGNQIDVGGGNVMNVGSVQTAMTADFFTEFSQDDLDWYNGTGDYDTTSADQMRDNLAGSSDGLGGIGEIGSDKFDETVDTVTASRDSGSARSTSTSTSTGKSEADQMRDNLSGSDGLGAFG